MFFVAVDQLAHRENPAGHRSVHPVGRRSGRKIQRLDQRGAEAGGGGLFVVISTLSVVEQPLGLLWPPSREQRALLEYKKR